MSKDDYLLKKIEDSHQAIAKTVSDFGDKVNKTNASLASLDTKLSGFIDRIDKKFEVTDKKFEGHDESIETLNEAKTTIFTSIATTKWVAGLLLTIIITMGGFIITTWSNDYDERLKQIELERKETLDKVLQLLSDKKNYLNYQEKEFIKDIFANL